MAKYKFFLKNSPKCRRRKSFFRHRRLQRNETQSQVCTCVKVFECMQQGHVYPHGFSGRQSQGQLGHFRENFHCVLRNVAKLNLTLTVINFDDVAKSQITSQHEKVFETGEPFCTRSLHPRSYFTFHFLFISDFPVMRASYDESFGKKYFFLLSHMRSFANSRMQCHRGSFVECVNFELLRK